MIQKLRIASLIGIQFLILAHIYIFGDQIIGSLDFQEFFHAFVKFGIINAGVVLVILAFVTTLIFGGFDSTITCLGFLYSPYADVDCNVFLDGSFMDYVS